MYISSERKYFPDFDLYDALMSDFLSYVEIEQLESELSELFERNAFGKCEAILRRLIINQPLKSFYFGQLGRVHKSLGALDAAQMAFRREHQLQLIEANTKTSPAVDRIEAIWAGCGDREAVFSIESFEFSKKRSSKSFAKVHAVIERVSLCGEALLQVCFDVEKVRAFERATEVISSLSSGRCQTAPALIASGQRVFSDLDGLGDKMPYRVISYSRADRGGFGYGDLIFSLLEQQKMGFYVNNLALENLRYDSIQALLKFADYSSALELPESIRSLKPRDFMDWCRVREQKRLSYDARYSFLLGSCRDQDWVWEGERLRAPSVQIIHKQKHASLPEHSIQSVETDELAFRGVIDWQTKSEALGQVAFDQGERVLDVGCGMGEGVRYFRNRGCSVTGIDTESRLVAAGQVISNIAEDGAVFLEHDFDYDSLSGEWDTVALLSVLHHFTNLEGAAKRILACCRKRILVESASKEVGYKWMGSWYRSNPAWQYRDEASFIGFLESLFQGFQSVGTPVESAHGRQLFTLARKDI